jgi:probable poly-beta-1,6-N-acetyl-D-glucosamine export protein
MNIADSREHVVFQLPILKGICVLGVVWIHVADPWRMRPDHWLTGVVYFLNSLARFAVPLFFVASGFYLSINPKNDRPLRFYRRTLKFLVIPYVAYSLMYSLPRVWGRGDWLQSICSDLLFGTACYHLWFVPVMARAYVLHPFLIRWYRTLGQPSRLVVAGLVLPIFWPALLSSVQQTLPQAAIPLRWLLGSSNSWFTALPTYVGFFILGYFASEHSDKIPAVRQRAVVVPSLLVWLAAATGIAALSSGPWSLFHEQLMGLLAVSLTLTASPAILGFVEDLPNRRPVYRNVLRSIGLYAYGIYFLHPVFLDLSRRLLVGVVGIRLESPFLLPLLFAVTAWSTLKVVRIVARSPCGTYLT